MSYRWLLLFSLILSLTVAPAWGQAVVEGTVSNGGEPLPGINVRVRGTSHGAATGADGRYRISGVEPGVYTLVASAVGFETARREVMLRPGDVRQIHFALEEVVLQGGEVVVTGTMRETYVKESPVKVDVVTARRLQRGRASSNLMDMIGSVNGLSSQLNCGVCYTNAIRINGVEGPNTAVLIDGMPIMGALASVYGLNGISPMIIDQVEVIKGPQSTLYGTQALGGVVNIITKDPALTPTLTANVLARSTHEGSLDLALAPKSERLKGFVSGHLYRMAHYFDDNGDGFADMPMRSRGALFAKGVLTGPAGERVLSVVAKAYGENRTGGVEGFSENLRGSSEVYGESIYTRRSELLGDYRPPGLDQQFRVSGALTYHDQDSYYGTDRYVARQQIAYGQATWDQPFSEAVRLLTGSTLRYEIYDDNTPATSTGADRRFIPGIFGQGEATLGDATFLGGLRLDHHGEHGLITAPRLSVKYSPSERTTLRASGGTGFRVVNVFTEDHAALTGSRTVLFTEDLEPERSLNTTMSLQHILPFGANPLTIDFDAFYTYFTNKIIPDYDQDPDLIVYENLAGYSVTRGVAIGLSQNFTALPLTYDAGFTLLDVFTVESTGQRMPVTYAADFMGTFGASYHLHGPELTLDYAVNLVGPKWMPKSYGNLGRPLESPTFTTHDFKLTKEFTNVNGPSGLGLEAYLSAENIFDFTQDSPLVAADAPFGDHFDTVYTWGPIVGRTVALGARLNLP